MIWILRLSYVLSVRQEILRVWILSCRDREAAIRAAQEARRYPLPPGRELWVSVNTAQLFTLDEVQRAYAWLDQKFGPAGLLPVKLTSQRHSLATGELRIWFSDPSAEAIVRQLINASVRVVPDQPKDPWVTGKDLLVALGKRISKRGSCLRATHHDT